MAQFKRCEYCGTLFHAHRSDRRTCGDACRKGLSRQNAGARRRYDAPETRERRRGPDRRPDRRPDVSRDELDYLKWVIETSEASYEARERAKATVSKLLGGLPFG